MEAGTVPRVASPRIPALSPSRFRLASDARLVALVREGRSGAFESLYDRHQRGILSFCRHLLGDQHEAEDAVQHTFMAAYSSLLASQQPIHLRPWLFAIARNRCYSILRAQRERPAADLEEESVTDGLAVEVERRQDLRDLVIDLSRLPDDQRAAIVLAELESLSHAEIAVVLSVPRDKVKALVFQARESLLASRTARDTSCHEIRTQLALGRAGALRRSNLRRHLRDCDGCRAYRAQVQRQRRQFAALLPVAPTLLAKEGVLAAALGAGGVAAVGGSGLIATSALKTGFLKGVAAAIIAGAGTLGTVVVSASDLPVHALGGGSGGGSASARVHHRAHSGREARHGVELAAANPSATAQASAVSIRSSGGIHHRSAASADRRTSAHDRAGSGSPGRGGGRSGRDHRGASGRAHGRGRVGAPGWSARPTPPGHADPRTAAPPAWPAAPHTGHALVGQGGQGNASGWSRGRSGDNAPPGWSRAGPHGGAGRGHGGLGGVRGRGHGELGAPGRVHRGPGGASGWGYGSPHHAFGWGHRGPHGASGWGHTGAHGPRVTSTPHGGWRHGAGHPSHNHRPHR